MTSDDMVGRPDPGAKVEDEGDLLIAVVFHTLLLAPVWLWAAAVLASIALWVLVDPWIGGTFGFTFLVGALAWAFVKARAKWRLSR